MVPGALSLTNWNSIVDPSAFDKNLSTGQNDMQIDLVGRTLEWIKQHGGSVAAGTEIRQGTLCSTHERTKVC